MSVVPIVTYNDNVLREKAATVQKNSKELQQLIDDMFDTMYNAEGVGLAAPQVGRLKRIFVADADVYTEEKEESTEEPAYGPLTFINPVISMESEETIVMEEGCLSIPEVMGPVSRPENISVTFKDRDFKEQTQQVGGHLARIIQHEIDHLNGVLFIDHLSYFKCKLVAAKLKALAEGEKEVRYPVVSKE